MSLSIRKLAALCIVASQATCLPIGTASTEHAAEPSKSKLSETGRPIGLNHFTPANPVTFERRDSNACPEAEGGAKWYARLEGPDAVRVTYGIRSNGEFDGRLHTFSINPWHSIVHEMMRTGDGKKFDWEPFVVKIEVLW